MSHQFHLIISLFLVCTTASVFKSPIPYGWEDMCKLDSKTTFRHPIIRSLPNAFVMRCDVTGKDGTKWQFKALRDRLGELCDVTVIVQVFCSSNGTISLPWPMKAHGLLGLMIDSCLLTDKYADYGNPVVSEIPDQLAILEIFNSVWMSDESELRKITSPEFLTNLSPDYDCGQDSTIEYMAYRNISYGELSPATENGGETTPTSPNIAAGEEESAEIAFVDFLNQTLQLEIRCNYERLVAIEDSSPQYLPHAYFTVLVHNAQYPELMHMNYSWSGMTYMPEELSDFRTYFPKLTRLDLSGNFLTEVSLSNRRRPPDSPYLFLDLRKNRIAHISLADLVTWARFNGVFVNLRENPIHCTCQIERLSQAIESQYRSNATLARYKYITNMTCSSPPKQKGLKLYALRMCTNK